MRLPTPLTVIQGASFTAQPANGAVITARLPPGLTYRAIDLLFTIAGVAPTVAQLGAQIVQIRLLVSGIEVMGLTAGQLLTINEFLSGTVTNDAGIVSLDFARLWGRTTMSQGADGRMGAPDILAAVLGTADQSSVEVEVTFAGAGVTITTASVTYHVSPDPQPAGIVRALRRGTHNSGVGPTDAGNVPLDRTATLLAIYLFPGDAAAVANIANVEYRADNVSLVNCSRAILNQRARRAWPYRRPQDASANTPMAAIDFTSDGFSGEGVPLASVGAHVIQTTFTAAQASTFPYVLELAVPLPGAPGTVPVR